MAVVRPSRSAPPVALITFVFLFLVALGLAIYFGLQMSSKDADLVALQELSKDAASSTDSPMVKDAIRGTSGTTAVRALTAQVQVLRAKLVGNSTKSIEDISKDVTPVLTAAGASNFVGAVDVLNGRLTKLQADLDTLKSQNASLNKDLQGLKGPYDASEATLRGQIAKLTQDIADKNTEIQKVNDQMKVELQKIQNDSDQRAREADDALRKASNMRETMQAQIDHLSKELADLRNPPMKGDSHPILWQADGRIVHTTIGADEVRINIGRKDHLRTNITFAIYDPKLGVGSGPEARGKGALEVIQVGETESVARITHTEPGETILEGDLIANLVFNPAGATAQGPFQRDRAKVYKFYVFGDFDLDGDGVATPSERDHIIRQIQAWGGEVVDKLDSQTDFLVLGTMPATDMSVKMDGDATQPSSELDAQRKAQKDQYIKLLVAAKDYAIPVLDANRFFAYIGYYNNTIVGKK